MLARLPVIIIGIPLVYACLVMGGNALRLAFFILVCLLGQRELNSMLNGVCALSDGTEPSLKAPKPIIEWACTFFILITSHFWGLNGLFISFSLSAAAIMMFTVLRGLRGDGTKRFAHAIISVLYFPFFVSCFLLLAKNLKNGGLVLFGVLCSVWALDIGAYVFGLSLKGPKLAPKISPNKTISGAVGGALCAILTVFAMGHWQIFALSQERLILLAVSIAVIGQIADLFESVLKRESALKDSGHIMGAHGGILDRIDSLLFLGPVCYAIMLM